MRFSSRSLIFSLTASGCIGLRCFSYGIASNYSQNSAFILSASGAIHNLAEDSASSSSSSRLFSSASPTSEMPFDPEYPGTAVERMLAVRSRVANLTQEELNANWEDVRRKLLWAGGLKDLPTAIPGQGYTGHSFNDYNHVDLTCMLDEVSYNQNDGTVQQIARGNLLGPGIRIASLPELGPGGSWSTCANGCNKDPPQDVAHIQFRSRIAYKLVWCPTDKFDTFVLVDDDGKELTRGTPTGNLPRIMERQANYRIVMGSKYATAADEIAKSMSTTN
ncbi:hypothetical protein IV203_007161 [Nitzschia inconspicua]|uniref:Uncharacterized protein n=1 Tax=Nitzschia inconspicua TaxID=303405 RepID=A0A9K3KEY2_9STRA|nr:hypothetical protein IV203_007161 [Nitzschia inconspicua]